MQMEENNEFDKTRELETLSDLNNQIVEVSTNISLDKEELEQKQEKPNTFFTPSEKIKLKDKIKIWWKKLNKKQKSFVIGGIILLFILIVFAIFFLVKSLTKKEEIPVPKEVIVQEENYRYENGVLVFLNNQKEEIGRYTCENQSEELCFVSYYTDENHFDTEKKIRKDGTPILTRSAIIADTFVFINDNPRKDMENSKLYNLKEHTSNTFYKTIKKVDQNQYIVQNENNRYGLIEVTENGVISKMDFIYEFLGYTKNDKNYFVSTQMGRNFIIDESGKNVSKAILGDIKNLNDTYIKVKLDTGKYEVYNYNNQNIFGESYDYAELYKDYAILIQDTKMYLKFYDKNKLNEDAIQLNNKDYIKTSVYDETNTLVETKEAYTLEENGDIITLTIKNGNDQTIQMVNKAEGNVSKNLRNMNYFDGKIYIYSNASKTELLGSYTCSNKNNLDKNAKKLKNCTLAEDTVFEDNDYEIPGKVGAIPIFNERFIFIYDNPDLVNDTNKTIVLYDLKKSSNLGKYREVNTYSYTGTSDITFSTVTDLQVVAKNQSGNFGVLKINLSEIVGHIGFNYSGMERLREYYVGKVPNGYQLISKKDGSSSSSVIPYKIRNYNKEYVKVQRDNKEYYIYNIQDTQGKTINSTGFKYIELYDKYFAGVNNSNQLGIYEYRRPERNILSGNELIQLNSDRYYGNGVLSFKINGNEILIGNNDAYIPAAQTIVLSE